MTSSDLERALATTAAVMAKVTPDQLDAATPCASWKVRDIVNHVVGGTYFFSAVAETGAAPEGGEVPDFAAGDYNAAYAEGRARMLTAFGAEGAMDKMMDFGFMKVPGGVAINVVMTDSLAHAWDLARAIGEPTDFDPELTVKLLAHSKAAIPDSFRGEDGKAAFGPIVDVSPSAPVADQLAGFLGRQV